MEEVVKGGMVEVVYGGVAGLVVIGEDVEGWCKEEQQTWRYREVWRRWCRVVW